MVDITSDKPNKDKNAILNHKYKANGVDIPLRVGLYFRGCVSNDDCRQLTYGAIIEKMSDNSGKSLKYLRCSIDGETVIEYQAGRNNNFITDQTDILPRVLPSVFELLRHESELYSKLIGKRKSLRRLFV